MDTNHFKVTPDLYATRGNRFVNFIIDWIIFRLVIFGVFMIIGIILFYVVDDSSVADSFIYKLENMNPILDWLLTAICLSVLYFSFELFTKGRSVGKYITKTKVVL